MKLATTTGNSGSMDGNVNFYSINRFESPFHPVVTIDTSNETNDDDDCETHCNYGTDCWDHVKCSLELSEYIEIYDDKLLLIIDEDTTIPFMRTNYYMSKLKGLDDFNGFFGRTFLPQAKIYKKDETKTTD